MVAGSSAVFQGAWTRDSRTSTASSPYGSGRRMEGAAVALFPAGGSESVLGEYGEKHGVGWRGFGIGGTSRCVSSLPISRRWCTGPGRWRGAARVKKSARPEWPTYWRWPPCSVNSGRAPRPSRTRSPDRVVIQCHSLCREINGCQPPSCALLPHGARQQCPQQIGRNWRRDSRRLHPTEESQRHHHKLTRMWSSGEVLLILLILPFYNPRVYIVALHANAPTNALLMCWFHKTCRIKIIFLSFCKFPPIMLLFLLFVQCNF
jgi:hypothetical protein